jgi:hypothetical protein
MPPLLAVARAAQAWMEAGLSERPDPLHALLAAIARCGSAGPAQTVFLPVWAAYPDFRHWTARIIQSVDFPW